ncbi:hypothetical protein J6590_067412 [Homalodisca vitripennis]|nr:hypothetical protein J6590_067412 [Homalodisca vitripennis]
MRQAVVVVYLNTTRSASSGQLAVLMARVLRAFCRLTAAPGPCNAAPARPRSPSVTTHRSYHKVPHYTFPRVPMAERSKSLDFELEIAQVRILSVTVAIFISTNDRVLYRQSLLFCLIRSSHRPVALEDGKNMA